MIGPSKKAFENEWERLILPLSLSLSPSFFLSFFLSRSYQRRESTSDLNPGPSPPNQIDEPVNRKLKSININWNQWAMMVCQESRIATHTHTHTHNYVAIKPRSRLSNNLGPSLRQKSRDHSWVFCWSSFFLSLFLSFFFPLSIGTNPEKNNGDSIVAGFRGHVGSPKRKGRGTKAHMRMETKTYNFIYHLPLRLSRSLSAMRWKAHKSILATGPTNQMKTMDLRGPEGVKGGAQKTDLSSQPRATLPSLPNSVSSFLPKSSFGTSIVTHWLLQWRAAFPSNGSSFVGCEVRFRRAYLES